MMVLNVLLLIFGVLAALVLLCLAVIWFEKKAPGEEFDERQKIDRGNAYRLSLHVGVFYFLGVFTYLQFTKNMEHVLLLLFIGLELQLMAFHIYCLLKRSALPLSQKPWHTIISYGIVSVVDVANFLMWRSVDSRYTEGIADHAWMELMTAVTFGALAVMHLISLLWKEKE